MRDYEVDECRRKLGELLRVEEALLEARAALEEDYRREETFAREHPEFGQTMGAYLTRYNDQKDQLTQKLMAIAQAIEVAREVLANAYKELKTVVLTQENRDRQAREERDRKEQLFLDELAQERYRRRQRKDPSSSPPSSSSSSSTDP
nr:flagellar FliJ family protein [Phaeovibrio sulfidiphilus]